MLTTKNWKKIICNAKLLTKNIFQLRLLQNLTNINTNIPLGILKSIKFRDGLYKKLKCTPQDNSQYSTIKQNLKVYNNTLKNNIYQLKQNYYHSQKDLGYHSICS